MKTEPSTRAVGSTVTHIEHGRLFWNGEPFNLTAPVRRKATIVRTKVVPVELRRQYNQTGWPRDLVIMREHSVKLLGEEIALKIVTNAEEAEEEIPECINTPIRDTGTYRDAVVYWRGRPVRSFVSARIAAAPVTKPVPSVPPPVADPTIQHMLTAALRVLKSGLIVTRAELPSKMDDDEKILANFLLSTHDNGSGRPLSLAEIGRILNCSDEAVRRRKRKLETKFPALSAVFRSFRSRNHKGEAVSPIRPANDEEDDAS